MVVIVDYGMGNLSSILNMLKKLGAPAMISPKTQDIEQADRLIFPGVGAFENGMSKIHQLGLQKILEEKVLQRNTPLLGICLGMHLMTRRSEEGKTSGLNWIKGDTICFRFDPGKTGLKIPHMGWNTVDIQRNGSLFKDFEADARFYFVHSYHVVCDDEEEILTTTEHGYSFVSSFQRDNIMGVQFHPEKSHKYGFKLLKNFLETV